MSTTWSLILRCYKCHHEFPVTGVAGTAIAVTADSSACPECGATAQEQRYFPTPEHHLIMTLTRKKN